MIFHLLQYCSNTLLLSQALSSFSLSSLLPLLFSIIVFVVIVIIINFNIILIFIFINMLLIFVYLFHILLPFVNQLFIYLFTIMNLILWVLFFILLFFLITKIKLGKKFPFLFACYFKKAFENVLNRGFWKQFISKSTGHSFSFWLCYTRSVLPMLKVFRN